jgi:hypothetical protein
MQALAQPMTQTIETTTAPVAQPVAQAVVATSAPAVQTAAPVIQTVNATVATTTQPVQSVVKPVIRQVTTVAAPTIQTAAPVIEQVAAPVAQTAAMAATTLVPPTEPVITPVTQTMAAAVAPIVTSIAPTLQTLQSVAVPVAAPMTATAPAAAFTTVAPALRTIVADAGHQSVAPISVALINRAEQPRVAPDAPPTPPTARTVDVAALAPFVGVSPATALPMIALPIVHRATVVAAELRTAPPAEASGISRTGMASSAPSAWITTNGDASIDMPALGQATVFGDQSQSPPSIAPAIPDSPVSPPPLPTDALATTTSATGTSGGHGFPLLLSLATAGWALVLNGRRLFPSALNLRQPTYRPLVSPG